jgi:hypothetical protein
VTDDVDVSLQCGSILSACSLSCNASTSWVVSSSGTGVITVGDHAPEERRGSQAPAHDGALVPRSQTSGGSAVRKLNR